MGAVPPHRGRVDGPRPASQRTRPLFDPRRGWFRRTERAVSHFLSRSVYPNVPGLRTLYDRLLKRQLTLSEATIPLPGLPEAFAGVRILLITDPHAGPFVSPAALVDAMARLQSVAPDLILIGGDLTSSRCSELETHAEAFRQLAAPLGVFGVMGNHDHYTEDPDRVRRLAEQLGVAMLHNRSVRLTRGVQSLHLAGVDDALFGDPDLDAALDGAIGPTLLLSHNPDLFFDAAERGVALTLSGHTHGGQIRIPGLGVLVRQSRYHLDEGRYRWAGRELVVSRGLGAVGLPWRAACPPEGVLLTLAPE